MTGEGSGLDVGVAYRRSVRGWIAAVEGVGTAWTARTPCADWDVRQLVNHVVGEDRWTKPLVEGLTIAEVGDALDGDLLGEEPSVAARAAAEEAVAAVEVRLPEGGTVHLSYGEESIGEYLWQLTADHLIHGWDLTAATGQDRAWTPSSSPRSGPGLPSGNSCIDPAERSTPARSLRPVARPVLTC